MKKLELTKSIEVTHSVDVCVIGGGPSGVAAAVSASRLGASVFLAEANGAFGGMGTLGLVPMFMSFADGEHFLTGDVARAVRDGISDDRTNSAHYYNIDPERLKLVYDRIVTDSEVKFTFFTTLVDALREDGRVTHAIFHAKRGFFAVEAKVFIDCTGDGDLAAIVGADYDQGDELGRTMPPTLCSQWANIDFSKAYKVEGDPLSRAIADGVFTYPDRHVPGIIRIDGERGVATGNMGHCFGVDGTDERSLTHGMLLGRRQAQEFDRFYREYRHGYENMFLCQTAPLLGVRETRRFICDYMMTLADFEARASFDDEIGRYSYPVDIHVMTPDDDAYDEYFSMFKNLRYAPGETYGIPYRSLLPIGFDNLLVAGRCIGADRYMQSSLRVMPCCLLTGQAAGTAAFLARECTTREIDIHTLQALLRAHDVYIPN